MSGLRIYNHETHKILENSELKTFVYFVFFVVEKFQQIRPAN